MSAVHRMNTGAATFLSRFSTCTSGLAITFGLIVLAGWAFHIQRFKTIIDAQVAVKANTGACMVGLGVALLLANLGKGERSHKFVLISLASVTSLVGLLSFLEFWYGWDLHIDQLLFRAGAEDIPGSVRPGLMSPITAIDFFLLGITVALLDIRWRWLHWLQSLFVTIAAVASIFGILDFVLSPESTHTHIAPTTAVILFALCFATLCARTESGLGALLTRISPGGELSRRLLPAAILIPIGIGWLRWKGERFGLYSDWTGLVIMAVSAAVLLFGLTLWTAVVLDRIETGRLRAEESVAHLAAIVRSSNDGIIGKTTEGVVSNWNRGAETIYGFSSEEIVGRSAAILVPPERIDEFEATLEHVRRGESVHQLETERLRKDGRRIFVSLSISPIRNDAGQVVAISTITRDITERKRADEKLKRMNQILQALSACTESMMRASDESAMLQQVCDAIVQIGGYRMAWVGYAEHDQSKTVRPVAWAGAEDGYLRTVNISWSTDVERGQGPTGTAIRTGKVFVSQDFANDPRMEPWRKEAEQRGYRCSIVLPLRTEEEVLGGVSVYSGEVDAFDSGAQQLLEQMAANLSYAIMALRARAQRDQIVQKLRESALYVRSLIEASLDPLVTIDKEGKIADVNEATEKATGVSRDLLIGSDFCDYFTDPEKAREGYGRVFQEGLVRDYPLAIRDSSGKTTDVLYNASVFRNAKGEVEGIFAAARDITERKRAEDEIRTLNRELEQRVDLRTAELKDSEQRVRRKLDAILTPEGDLGHLTLADILDLPALRSLAEDFHKLTGIPMAIIDLTGTILIAVGLQEACTRFHRVHPETCKNCLESDTVLSRGVAQGEFKIYKCKNNIWDGVTPLMLGGQHLGNLFIGQFFFADEAVDYQLFRDQAKQYSFDERDYLRAIDLVPRLSQEEIKNGTTFLTKFAQLLSQLSYSSIKLARSTEQVSRVNTELSATVKELEAFTYSVSHDLRAPLRHISGFSKILSEEFSTSLPPDAQHHVLRIQEGTRRMGQLVDDLLNLGRVGRRELSLQVTGLRSVVDGVINNLKVDVGDRRVEWKIGDLPYVECDPGLTEQVFQNLLSNALKFTRPRTQAIIEIGQERRNGGSVIYVRDNGVGFSMKYADKLFGVFQRLHRSEDFEGTGVGLATVQRIIQKHGGRIWAEGELDRGASFYFTLGNSEASEEQNKAMVAGGKP